LILAVLLTAASGVCALGGPEDVFAGTLPNGMRVIVKEGHTVNLVSVDVWIKAGSVNEDASKNGISHLTEHMVFKATKKYGPGQIDREIEGIGAEVNGGTSKDYVHFYTTVASQYLPTALDVLSDAVMNALFRAEDVEKERRVVLDEIARDESDPLRRAIDMFIDSAYSTHPYRLHAAGSRDSVSKLTRDELYAYYCRRYTPRNTCVSVAGDVSLQDALKAVSRAFDGYERIHPDSGVDTVPPKEPARSEPSVHSFTWQQSSKAYVILGFPAAPASSMRDVCALDTIVELFGDTYRGRISSALSASQIKFGQVVTDFVTQKYPGMIYVVAVVAPSDVSKAADVILNEFRRVAADPVSMAESADAKSRALGSDLYEMETFSGQARILGMYDCISSCDQVQERASTIPGLSASDISSTAKAYFTGNNYTLVTIEPESKSGRRD
jgi:zinc protease